MQTSNWNELLENHYGFTQFRLGQSDCLTALDSHNRALAVFPTGGGKSICYQLPALTYDGLTLVVSPLIALMKDQIDFLKQRGVAAARLDSTLTLDENRAIHDSLAAGQLKLLYIAPERMKNERFMAMIARHKISLLAIDEAHCISEWGHNFRPDYLKLPETARALGVERILALTATATPAVVKDVCAQFDIPDEAAIVTGFYRPNLKIAVSTVTAADRDAVLLRRLQARAPGPTIIYVTLQQTAENVAERLQRAGLPAEAYHAGMKPDDRAAVQDRWKESDSRIVVATIAFGMGIDKANVRYVYHYNMPKSLENYSQEIGRAGRDGVDSIVEILACADDIPPLENFVYGDTPTEDALQALTDDLMRRGEHFDVSLYELSARHDIRQLVLKTALTYMELAGALREGTPFYAGYKFELLRSPEAIAAKFDAQRGQFLLRVFSAGKKGTRWITINPEAAAQRLNEPRDRIVRALEFLADSGDIELKAAELRNRFSRLPGAASPGDLAADLAERFNRRESDEIARLQRLVDFIEHEGCHANALADYFGEKRDTPCGVCAQCITGKAVKMPGITDSRYDNDLGATESILKSDDAATLALLRSENPTALAHPRQVARFLCGLSSPALAKARLGRHPLCGSLAYLPFARVLAGVADKTP